MDSMGSLVEGETMEYRRNDSESSGAEVSGVLTEESRLAAPLDSPQEDDPTTMMAKKDLLVALLSKDLEGAALLMEKVKTLTNRSLNYRIEGTTKETLLHKSVTQGLPPTILQLLLDNGARVDARDVNKASPLHYAALHGFTELVEYLLVQKANPMLKDKHNQTALHKAATGGHPDAIEVLLSHSALINHQDTMGNSALHLAAKNERAEAVECLVRRGADMLRTTREGLRPVDCLPEAPGLSKKGAKYSFSPQAKRIYKFLKRKGGCKKVAAPVPALVLGDGSRGHSIDHRNGLRSLTHDFRGTPREEVLDEVSLESSESLEEGEVEEPSVVDTTTTEGPRLDKRGFLIKEGTQSATEEEIPVSKKRVKKNAAKEEKRALKWISLFSDWDESFVKSYERIVKLCDQGIPDSVRGEAWKHLSGIASEGRDDQLYHNLLKQDKWEITTKIQIEKDIHRTMPGHILFQEKGQGRAMLTNVLLAYSAYNPEVGYCQGMGFATAMFLMYMTEEVRNLVVLSISAISLALNRMLFGCWMLCVTITVWQGFTNPE